MFYSAGLCYRFIKIFGFNYFTFLLVLNQVKIKAFTFFIGLFLSLK